MEEKKCRFSMGWRRLDRREYSIQFGTLLQILIFEKIGIGRVFIGIKTTSLSPLRQKNLLRYQKLQLVNQMTSTQLINVRKKPLCCRTFYQTPHTLCTPCSLTYFFIKLNFLTIFLLFFKLLSALKTVMFHLPKRI